MVYCNRTYWVCLCRIRFEDTYPCRIRFEDIYPCRIRVVDTYLYHNPWLDIGLYHVQFEDIGPCRALFAGTVRYIQVEGTYLCHMSFEVNNFGSAFRNSVLDCQALSRQVADIRVPWSQICLEAGNPTVGCPMVSGSPAVTGTYHLAGSSYLVV